MLCLKDRVILVHCFLLFKKVYCREAKPVKGSDGRYYLTPQLWGGRGFEDEVGLFFTNSSGTEKTKQYKLPILRDNDKNQNLLWILHFVILARF